MDILFLLCVGITLSAACGFRIFIPLWMLSLAGLYGELELTPTFQWIETYWGLTLVVFLVGIEIISYYQPMIAHILDGVEIPGAIAGGTIILTALLSPLDLPFQGIMALVLGGGVAGIVQSFTTVTRLDSTHTTQGRGNFLIATLEALNAFALSLLALLFPLLSALLVIVLLGLMSQQLWKFLYSRRR